MPSCLQVAEAFGVIVGKNRVKNPQIIPINICKVWTNTQSEIGTLQWLYPLESRHQRRSFKVETWFSWRMRFSFRIWLMSAMISTSSRINRSYINELNPKLTWSYTDTYIQVQLIGQVTCFGIKRKTERERERERDREREGERDREKENNDGNYRDFYSKWLLMKCCHYFPDIWSLIQSQRYARSREKNAIKSL